MKYIFLNLLLFLPVILFAQVNATTEEGKKVLLYENGTWEYVPELKSADMVEEAVLIDSTLNKESLMQTLFYDVSERLARFFGKEKGKVKGNAKVVFVNGVAKIVLQLDYPIADANRYYGKVEQGIKVVLHTSADQQIELFLNDQVQFKTVERYNYSSYTLEMELNAYQLQLLSKVPMNSIEIFWKKNTENYTISNKKLFIESLEGMM